MLQQTDADVFVLIADHVARFNLQATREDSPAPSAREVIEHDLAQEAFFGAVRREHLDPEQARRVRVIHWRDLHLER